MELLVYLGLVLWFTISFLTAWFDGGIRDALLRKIDWISEDLVLKDDINRQLVLSKGVIGSFLACPICFSGYVAAAFGLIFFFLFQLNWYFPIACFFLPQWLAGKLFK